MKLTTKNRVTSPQAPTQPISENIMFSYQHGDKRVVFGKSFAGVVITIVVCTAGAPAHSIQLLAQILAATPLKKWLGF